MNTLGIVVALVSAAANTSPSEDGAPSSAPGPWLPGCVATVDALPSARAQTTEDRRRLEREQVLVASKSTRRLMLFEAGELRACWSIGLGRAPSGHKLREGDGRTPEGWYRISDKPWSSFEGAIAIHYPATRDAAVARRAGTISAREHRRIAAATRTGSLPPQRTAMGGAILIHGGGGSSDWTLGCIALDDPDLNDLRARLAAGMRGHIAILD